MTQSNDLFFPPRFAVLPDRPLPALPADWTSPLAGFVVQAHKRPSQLLVRDNSGEEATYGDGLIASIALGLTLDPILREDGEYVGLLLPPSKAGMFANLATSFIGKVPINLNYSSGNDPINSAIKQTGLKKVLTSKKVLERFKIDAEPIFLEDIVPTVSRWTKAQAWGYSRLPLALMRHVLPGLGRGLEDVNTIMFTSGSTGEPKGVVLTNGNFCWNALQLWLHAQVGSGENMLGCLPYFHSYGYGVTQCAALMLGMSVFAYNNPLDARGLCKFVGENKISIMASTPTFMRNYLKRCEKEQFASMKMLMLGSEKLKEELAADIRKQLGFEALEGYGMTELAPVVSSCVHLLVKSPATGLDISGNRPGSVGQAVPGTAFAVVDPKTGKLLPRGRANEGRIFCTGPQLMRGYFNKPVETANVIQNGWYYSGDVGAVDEDGFIFLTDRESRFAKVGPEMVPLILVEKALREKAGCNEIDLQVVGIPDESKGEKVVVLYIPETINPGELTKALTATGMHTLWIPKAADFHRVEGPFPTAGIGKLDMKAIKKMALALDGQS